MTLHRMSMEGLKSFFVQSNYHVGDDDGEKNSYYVRSPNVFAARVVQSEKTQRRRMLG